MQNMSLEREVLNWLDDMCERTTISEDDRLEFSKAREALRKAMREGLDEIDALHAVCRSLIETCNLWIKREAH
jgi:hypothetical protein